jgi:hypothetical protein
MNYRGKPLPAWEEHFGANRTIKDSLLHFEREFNRNSAVGQKRTYGELYASGDLGKRLPFLNDMSGSDPFHNTRELSHIKRASGHTGRWPVIFNDDVQSGYTPNQAECGVYISELRPSTRLDILSGISEGHPLPGWPVFMVRERNIGNAAVNNVGDRPYKLLDIIDMNSALRADPGLQEKIEITYIGIRDNTSQRPGSLLPTTQKILVKYAGYADIPHMFRPIAKDPYVRYAWFVPTLNNNNVLHIQGCSTTKSTLPLSSTVITRHVAFSPTYVGQFCDVSDEESTNTSAGINIERPGVRCGYHVTLCTKGKHSAKFDDSACEIKTATRGINLAG